jgi:hypothetical protein
LIQANRRGDDTTAVLDSGSLKHRDPKPDIDSSIQVVSRQVYDDALRSVAERPMTIMIHGNRCLQEAAGTDLCESRRANQTVKEENREQRTKARTFTRLEHTGE